MAAVPELGRAAGVEHGAARGAAATHALYERYARQIYGFCYQRLGNREEAEDAVQTTFMNAFRGLSRGVSPEAEAAWLYKIAHNVCLTRRRAAGRRGRVEAPSDIQTLQEFVAAPQRLGSDELIELQEALASMCPNQRKAILLREWRGLSYREIAGELGLTQGAVETLIFRARRSLARGLEAAPDEERRVWKRVRQGMDVGSLLGILKSLISGGAVAKAVASAAAVTTTAVVSAVPGDERIPRRAQLQPVTPAVEPAEPKVTESEPAAVRVAPVVREVQSAPVAAAPRKDKPAAPAPKKRAPVVVGVQTPPPVSVPEPEPKVDRPEPKDGPHASRKPAVVVKRPKPERAEKGPKKDPPGRSKRVGTGETPAPPPVEPAAHEPPGQGNGKGLGPGHEQDPKG